MATELLIFRRGEQYIRLVDNGYQLCTMNKASVFPLADLAQVRKTLNHLTRQGGEDIRLHKLTIIEEPYEEI